MSKPPIDRHDAEGDMIDALVDRLERLQEWKPAPSDPAVQRATFIELAHSPRRPHRRFQILAAAAVVMTLVGAGVWFVRGNDEHEVTVADEPAGSGFGSWGPGWHELDTGPVPAGAAEVIWQDGELWVFVKDSLHAFDPSSRRWRSLASPPFSVMAAVSIGDSVVVIGEEAIDGGQGVRTISSMFDPSARRWSPPITVPVPFGADGPRDQDLDPSLIWTGSHVIDTTHGAVFDPSSRTWSDLARPKGERSLAYVQSATSVLFRGEVVAAVAINHPSLAWSADGTSVRDLPALPEEIRQSTLVPDSSSVVHNGRIVVSDIGADSGTFLFDGTTWSRMASLPHKEPLACPRLVDVRGELLAAPCGDTRLWSFDGVSWVSEGEPPIPVACCTQTALEAGGALVVWSGSDDTANDPIAPYVRGAVWLPSSTGK